MYSNQFVYIYRISWQSILSLNLTNLNSNLFFTFFRQVIPLHALISLSQQSCNILRQTQYITVYITRYDHEEDKIRVLQLITCCST